MSAENKLTSELAKSATRATQAIGDEVRAAIASLREKAPEYAEKADEIAGKAAYYLEEGLAGRIDPAMAREASRRETEALELLAKTASEVGKQELLRRTQRVIDIASHFALSSLEMAAKIGVSVVIGGL